MFVMLGGRRLVGVSPASDLAAGGGWSAECAARCLGHGAGREHQFAWVSADRRHRTWSGWRRRGVRFDRAFSTSSWTLPSHASMFTGRWPHEFRADWKSPCGTMYRRSRNISPRVDTTQRGSWRISIIAAGRPGLLAGLLITRIFRSASSIPSFVTLRSGGGSTSRRAISRLTRYWRDRPGTGTT